jgi:hypothetical protein
MFSMSREKIDKIIVTNRITNHNVYPKTVFQALYRSTLKV